MNGPQRTGYESARPTRVCASSGRRFEPGERYVATLVETPGNDDLVRFDFSVAAWESGARPAADGGMIAMWRATAAEGEASRQMRFDDEELFGLFESMSPEVEGRAAAFRYLLALMLMRRRRLRVVDQRVGEQGRPVLLLVRRGGVQGVEPETYEVVDPGMDEEAIAAGIAELGAVIAGEPAESARGVE